VLSISAIGQVLVKAKVLKNYYKAIEAQAHARVKSVNLSQGDIVRGEVIRELSYHFYIDNNKINQQFAEDLPLLQTVINDRLIIVTINEIRV
jgi:oxygen-independent coproporphyrinogen-3 oxidase